jgi:hypothetical protein
MNLPGNAKSTRVIIKEVKDIKNLTSNALGLIRPNQSLASKAKDAFHIYPLMVSEDTVRNVDTENLMDLVRFLENYYLLFTMTTLGLDPALGEGETVRTKLRSIYSHEGYVFDDNSYDFSNEKITDSIRESIIANKVWDEYNPSQSEETNYNTHSPRNKETPEQRKKREEEERKSKEQSDKDKKEAAKNNKSENVKVDAKDKSAIESNFKKLEEKTHNADPLVAQIKFSAAGHSERFEFPLMVKVNVKNITSDEIISFLDYISLKNFKYLRNAKLWSGEISLIKDIILQLDRAKKDAELYAKLNRNPWLREIMERYRTNFNKKAIQYINKGGSESGSTPLPLHSLCLTKNELEFGVTDRAVKVNKQKLMSDFMLMSMVVIDPIRKEMDISFNGIKGSMTYSFADLHSKSKDDVSTNKMLNTVISKI